MKIEVRVLTLLVALMFACGPKAGNDHPMATDKGHSDTKNSQVTEANISAIVKYFEYELNNKQPPLDPFPREIIGYETLTPDEAQTLRSYFASYSISRLSGKQVPLIAGKTVGQILELATGHKDDLATLQNSLTLTVHEKGQKVVGAKMVITLKGTFQNTTRKNMRSFTGSVVFLSSANDVLRIVHIVWIDLIKAGLHADWNAAVECDERSDADQVLKNARLGELRVPEYPVVASPQA